MMKFTIVWLKHGINNINFKASSGCCFASSSKLQHSSTADNLTQQFKCVAAKLVTIHTKNVIFTRETITSPFTSLPLPIVNRHLHSDRKWNSNNVQSIRIVEMEWSEQALTNEIDWIGSWLSDRLCAVHRPSIQADNPQNVISIRVTVNNYHRLFDFDGLFLSCCLFFPPSWKDWRLVETFM